MNTHALLKDVCDIVQGGRHGLSGNHFVNAGYPAFGAGGMNGYLESFEFERQAVVLSSIGARCGKCFYAEGRWSSLANTQVILPDPDQVDVRFLWFQLNDESRWPRSGSAQPFIKPSDVKAHRIYLPSLPEQRRIAAILDQAEALRAKRRAALAKLDTLAQGIFIEMFGDQVSNPMGWPLETLGKFIVNGPQNGLYKPADQYGEGTPILRIDGFYSGRLTNAKGLKRVRLGCEEKQTYALAENDIVINRVNSPEYLGKCAVIPALSETTVFESNMMRLAVDSSLLHPKYLVVALQGPSIRGQIKTRAKHAINQSSINQKDVQGFTLPMPPIDLQHRFSDRLSKLESVAKCFHESLSQLNALFSSLQHRAFRGEL